MKAAFAIASSLLASMALTGCVERWMTIETVPEKADIYLDGRSLGESPVTVPFTHYGTREIVCRKEGYLPRRAREVMEAPSFQEFPWDFYYETLTSDQFTDHRTYRYVLEPTSESDTSRERVEEKMSEAREMRLR